MNPKPANAYETMVGRRQMEVLLLNEDGTANTATVTIRQPKVREMASYAALIADDAKRILTVTSLTESDLGRITLESWETVLAEEAALNGPFALKHLERESKKVQDNLERMRAQAPEAFEKVTQMLADQMLLNMAMASLPREPAETPQSSS